LYIHVTYYLCLHYHCVYTYPSLHVIILLGILHIVEDVCWLTKFCVFDLN
jgi:hypothetical protein